MTGQSGRSMKSANGPATAVANQARMPASAGGRGIRDSSRDLIVAARTPVGSDRDGFARAGMTEGESVDSEPCSGLGSGPRRKTSIPIESSAAIVAYAANHPAAEAINNAPAPETS